jgi:UDP-N-acetylglucosamine 2-epimerase
MLVMNMVGARPNFMKIAPVVEALRQAGGREYLVHTTLTSLVARNAG